MFHLTSIITRCQEALENDNLDQDEIISVCNFMFPDNEIKYNNLDEINKLRNKNRGYLILSNHTTTLSDFVLIRCIIDAYTVANAGLLLEYSENIESSKHYNNLCQKAKLLEYLNSNLQSNGLEVKQNIINKINTNNNVIVFPEGKIAHDASLQPFKKGLFYLAYENKIPILPIIINYKNEIYFNCEKEIQKINCYILDDYGIDVNILNYVYPEDFDSFDEFYNVVYNKMNEIYIKCRNTNQN